MQQGPCESGSLRASSDSCTNAVRELKKIKIAWPDLNYSTSPGLLILLPSVP